MTLTTRKQVVMKYQFIDHCYICHTSKTNGQIIKQIYSVLYPHEQKVALENLYTDIFFLITCLQVVFFVEKCVHYGNNCFVLINIL